MAMLCRYTNRTGQDVLYGSKRCRDEFRVSDLTASLVAIHPHHHSLDAEIPHERCSSTCNVEALSGVAISTSNPPGSRPSPVRSI